MKKILITTLIIFMLFGWINFSYCIEENNSNEISNNILNNTNVNNEILNSVNIIKNVESETTNTARNEVSENVINENIITEETENVIEDIGIGSDLTIIDNEDIMENINGIWISEDARECVLNIVNNHSLYTYSINPLGFLECNNIAKENEFIEYSTEETPIDIVLNYYINNSDKKIVIKLSDTYISTVNGFTQEINIENSRFVTEDENQKIIILNPLYFLNNQGYKPELVDYLIKGFENNINTEMMPLTSDATSAKMNADQTVYYGPSDDYASVGSVDSGEQIHIIGKTGSWYHIRYKITTVSNYGKYKIGYVPESTVTDISNNTNLFEEVPTGGFRIPTQNLSVRSYDDIDLSIEYGTIFKDEGVTLIYSYSFAGEYNISYIEYSTSVGVKRGYVYTNQLVAPITNTSIALVEASEILVYSTPERATRVSTGKIYSGEYITVLEASGGVKYIEYNTTSGRKRGYIYEAAITEYNNSNNHIPITVINENNVLQATGNLPVYLGPSTNYASAGSIFDDEVVYYSTSAPSYIGNSGYYFIEYLTSTGRKRGYIQQTNLESVTKIVTSIPAPIEYSVVTSGTYGKSGYYYDSANTNKGRNLPYYKMGNGENVFFCVVEQHGFEDHWSQDGIELVKIANQLISDLASLNETDIFNNWTIYVFPSCNPDGLLYGTGNQGPGRHSCYSMEPISHKGIDMNRCWFSNASSFQAFSGENYNGTEPFQAYEARDLRDFLLENKSTTGENVLVELHGWTTQLIGNQSVYKYYGEQFTGNIPSNSYGDSLGYLIGWFKNNISTSTALIELPENGADGNKILSGTDVINNNFAGKFSTATINLLYNFLNE